MNTVAMLVVGAVFFGIMAIAMVLANPWFEDKKLLALTAIPTILCGVCAAVAAGLS